MATEIKEVRKERKKGVYCICFLLMQEVSGDVMGGGGWGGGVVVVVREERKEGGMKVEKVCREIRMEQWRDMTASLET